MFEGRWQISYVRQIQSQFDFGDHCVSPWLILNMVFFVLIRVTHLFYWIAYSFIIFASILVSPSAGNKRLMSEAEHLAYLGLPKMVMATACLLFLVTLLGEIADGEPLFRGKITARAFCSMGFSVLSLANSMAASLHFYILYPLKG